MGESSTCTGLDLQNADRVQQVYERLKIRQNVAGDPSELFPKNYPQLVGGS